MKAGLHSLCLLRDRVLKQLSFLSGVSVGDIGMKLALDTVDNGFLYLQNVRIPRANLLCKNAEVLYKFLCGNHNLTSASGLNKIW